MGGPAEIVIVGGSLSGLMCGVALKHAGHNVCIYEQDFDQRQSHMAGVSLGPDVEKFLALHDRLTSPFYIESTGAQILWPSGAKRHFPSKRLMSSWDALYYRLRANFDGYVSSYCSEKPATRDTDGTATYRARHKVLDIREDSKETSNLVITTEKRETGELETVSANFIIGADGPSSFVRAKYLPECQRQYVGHVAWRGIVPENDVLPETREFFDEMATISLMKRQHCLVYMIPGTNGSLKFGERFLNFVWYTNETEADLSDIMVDATDGSRHHYTVPAGHIQDKIWQKCRADAETIPFAPQFLEIVRKIEKPFLQVITECCAPHAVFENGKVLLIGDAVALMRPNTGFSGSQAAYHTARAVDYIQGKIKARQFDETITRFSTLQAAQSVWWGTFYQSHILVALWTLLVYWRLCIIDYVRAWWSGTVPLLRTHGQSEERIKRQ